MVQKHGTKTWYKNKVRLYMIYILDSTLLALATFIILTEYITYPILIMLLYPDVQIAFCKSAQVVNFSNRITHK